MVMLCSAPVSLSRAETLQDAVGVDVEGDLDLRHAARRRPDVLQPESAEHAIVGGQLPLALQHHDVHRRLVVLRGGEHLAAAGRDGRVALDDLGHHPAERSPRPATAG